MADLDRARRRWRELQDTDALEALQESCQAAVVEVASAPGLSSAHRPVPAWDEQTGRPRASSGIDRRIGLDVRGRATIAEHGHDGGVWTRDLITWGDGDAELADVRHGRLAHLFLVSFEDGRAAEVVELQSEGPYAEVTRYDYGAGGAMTLALRVNEHDGAVRGWTATRYSRPPGVRVHEPAPPDPGVALPERHVTPRARLQLRFPRFDGIPKLGLDAVAGHAVERVVYRVNGPVEEQLFGFPQVVQDDPRGDGQVALLHLGTDALGGDFLDAGDLLFFGERDDVRAQRWDQLTIWPSSC